MAVGQRLRFEIFKRDEFTCQYCGRTPPAVVLNCDHVVPVSGDGTDDPLNLITSCWDCNIGKSNVPLSQVPRPIGEQLEEATERRLQVNALNEFLMEQRAAVDTQVKQLGIYFYNLMASDRDRDQWVFPNDRAASIRTFLKHLTYAEILEAMDIATKIRASLNNNEKRWKYLCGVCWGKINERR